VTIFIRIVFGPSVICCTIRRLERRERREGCARAGEGDTWRKRRRKQEKQKEKEVYKEENERKEEDKKEEVEEEGEEEK